MEAIVISALGALLVNALSGIVGNRADAAVTAAWQAILDRLEKGGKPVNHDLQRSVLRSFILALRTICDDCVRELQTKKKEHNKDIGWIEQKRRSLDKELKDIEKVAYIEPSLESLSEIQLLVLPDGSLAQDKINAVRSKLIDAAIRDGEPPRCFTEKVENVLFERMCAYFAQEIKTNERVRNIFEGQLLSQIDVRLQGQELKLDHIIKSLRSMVVPPVPAAPVFLYRRQILEELYGFYVDLGPDIYVYADQLDSWESARSAGDDNVYITALSQLTAERLILATTPKGERRAVVRINPEKAQEIQRIVLLGQQNT